MALRCPKCGYILRNWEVSKYIRLRSISCSQCSSLVELDEPGRVAIIISVVASILLGALLAAVTGFEFILGLALVVGLVIGSIMGANFGSLFISIRKIKTVV